MHRFRQLRLRLRERDEGVALVMVIGVGSVLTLLIVAAVALSVGSSRNATADEQWNAALAAAYAGVEEYQARLSDEPSYVKYGNPSSTFSNPSGNAVSTVQLPITLNPAFGLGATGTWVTVPGSTNASFRYEVDNSTYAATGTIRVRSTGKVGERVRSITADLRQQGFIDFLYFTDYEMSDPAVVGGGCPLTYRWAGRGSNCTIQFSPTDRIGGPAHSNDTILTCGPTKFLGEVTTGNPAGGYDNGGCAAASFDYGSPQYSPVVSMPATNTELKKETRTDAAVSEDVPRPGCLYTGPTRITFLDNGKMNVRSPWTKFTTVKGDPATAGDATSDSRCGAPAALRAPAGAEVNVPTNNVVYVQNIPLTGINSATLAETTSSGNNRRCKDTSGNSLSVNSNSYSQNVVGYPLADEVPPQPGVESDDSYGCRNGDLFVSGRLSGGAVTMAAENYVYVTGDITYRNADDDMLGLIGQNAVWVHNPIRSNGSFLTAKNRTISAAILSVQHTFLVQNHTRGSDNRGTLTVMGAIAQKFRGPVGVSNGTGFLTKNYLYDTRFRYTAPPKFLSPVTTTYGVNVWVETAPPFNIDGTYR